MGRSYGRSRAAMGCLRIARGKGVSGDRCRWTAGWRRNEAAAVKKKKKKKEVVVAVAVAVAAVVVVVVTVDMRRRRL
jgi:hypothetical protein